jgi:hypothetical protein
MPVAFLGWRKKAIFWHVRNTLLRRPSGRLRREAEAFPYTGWRKAAARKALI